MRQISPQYLLIQNLVFLDAECPLSALAHGVLSDFLQEYYKFDQPISGKILALLSKYSKVHFGSNFNQSIDNLPDTVEEIYLGYSFDQKIIKLPKNLKILKFSHMFNQEIDILPEYSTAVPNIKVSLNSKFLDLLTLD